MLEIILNKDKSKTVLIDNDKEYKDTLSWLNEKWFMEVNNHGFDIDSGFWINYIQLSQL